MIKLLKLFALTALCALPPLSYAANSPVNLQSSSAPASLSSPTGVAWASCPNIRAKASTSQGALIVCQNYLGVRQWVPFGSGSEDMERLGLSNYPSSMMCRSGSHVVMLKYVGKDSATLYYETPREISTTQKTTANIQIKNGRLGSENCHNLNYSSYSQAVSSGEAW